MKKTIRVSAALLPPSLRLRFNTLIGDAGKRSIVAWQVTDHASAEVLLKEPGDQSSDQRFSIYVSDDPVHGPDGRSLSVPLDFRVANLMDVLDLAAVRVMAARDESATPAPTTESKPLYRLKHWVFLDETFSGPPFVRVLAAMSRKAVSRDWMESACGLSSAQVDALLHTLNTTGALVLTHQSTSTQAQAPTASLPSGGFVGRLRRWIGGARRQTALQA